jgi:hypothetical protein
MTMRLDIVTNDAGELVRREHARELGASVVIAIYRLAKLCQVHDLQNQAFTRQLEQTHQMIGEYCLRSGMNVSVLFANKAIFVAGQLLKGSRATYEAAAELGDIFERLGGSDLFIERSLTREELYAFAEQISVGYRSAPGSFRSPTPKIRLRVVNDAARLRGMELEDLTEEQRIVRAYASAVVIMRRFYEDLNSSKYILPRRIKRIAQSLVDLSAGSTPAYLGVTEVRNANYDEAGRAVNTAILAVSIARECTQERGILAQIAMAAMMHDVSRPRAMALASAGGPAMPGMAGPASLSEDQEDRLAAGAAAVLTALGRVNEPSITRTVLTFEALWLRRQTWLGPVYWGVRTPTLHAKMISIARRYNDLLTPEPGLLPPPPDYAIAALSEELKDAQDRAVLRMLVAALGLLPVGTVVQLNTGEVAEILRGPSRPGEKPRIKLVADPHGQPYNPPPELELAEDPRRQVGRVISIEGWKQGLRHRPGGQGEIPEDGGYDPDAQNSAPPPPPQEAMPPPAQSNLPPLSPLQPVPMPLPGQVAAATSQAPLRSRADQYADQYAQWGGADAQAGERRDSSSVESGEHNSSASLPSLGSSPSAVAEAMGRMINDSLAPPAAPPREGDRTVMQPQHGESNAPPGRVSKGPRNAREPTARGNLAATPLPHVLVYMLDHALSGSVVFENEASNDTINFVNGVPTKIRLHEPVGLLGEVLLAGGALDEAQLAEALDGAKRLGILLGEFLVGNDVATRAQVDWGLEAQILQKIAHIANLPPEIEYAYYRDADLLEGWGGGEVPMSAPLNPILASVRNWLDRNRVRATLNRIGKHSLVIHEDSDLSNLALLPEEQAVLDVIQSEALSLPQLFKREIADEETVSSLVYSLAVTRQFAFKGQKKGPMAARGTSAWRAAEVVAAKSGSHSALGSQPQPAAPSGAPVASGPISSAKSGTSPRGPGASSSRTNVPAIKPAVAAGGGASPPGPEIAPRAASPSGNAPVVARKAPAPAASPPGGPRPIAPAIRPIGSTGSLPKVNAPRIQKKGTMVGLQPAAPPEARAPSQPPADHPSMPPDDAKTIALVAPSFKDLIAKRPGVPLPSKSVPPKGPASAPKAAPKVAPKAAAPAATASRPSSKPMNGFGDAGGMEIELDDGPVGGDPEMGEAEQALEAMTNFRLAEAALQRNDTAAALALAEKAAAADPSQHDYAILVAWIRSLAGDPREIDKAISTMSKVLLDEPSNEGALLYRGKLLVRTNRLHDALTDFNELLATNPQHREAATELRTLKQRMGAP